MGKRAARALHASSLSDPSLPDVDSDGFSRSAHGSQAQRGRRWYPDGPITLFEVLGILRTLCFDFVISLRATGMSRVVERLTELMQEGWIATSVCYGVATFEMAAAMVTQFVIEALRLDPNTCRGVICYSTTEKDAAAGRIIAAHSDEFRPLHRFGDVKERLYDADREALELIQTEKLDELRQAKELFTSEVLAKVEFKEVKENLGREILQEMTAELEQMEFREEAYCYACDKMCSISPRRGLCEEEARLHWVDGAGTNCFPFSTINQDAPKWIDPSTMPALVLQYSSLFLEPDQLIRENVQHSDDGPLIEMMEKAGIEKQPTSMHTRGEVDGKMTVYKGSSKVFSPTDLGIPSNRHRRYGCFDLTPYVERICSEPFEKFFYRRLMCGPSVYMAAPDDMINEMKQRMARSKNLDAVDGSGNAVDDLNIDECSFECLFTPSVASKVEQYKTKASEQHMCNENSTVWNVPLALCNARNVEGYGVITQNAVPALLRGSLLVDLVSMRPFTHQEHWIIQGFPFSQFEVPDGFSSFFPTDVVSRESEATQKSLTGNAMHLAQIGAWILYNLAFTSTRQTNL